MLQPVQPFVILPLASAPELETCALKGDPPVILSSRDIHNTTEVGLFQYHEQHPVIEAAAISHLEQKAKRMYENSDLDS